MFAFFNISRSLRSRYACTSLHSSLSRVVRVPRTRSLLQDGPSLLGAGYEGHRDGVRIVGSCFLRNQSFANSHHPYVFVCGCDRDQSSSCCIPFTLRYLCFSFNFSPRRSATGRHAAGIQLTRVSVSRRCRKPLEETESSSSRRFSCSSEQVQILPDTCGLFRRCATYHVGVQPQPSP